MTTICSRNEDFESVEYLKVSQKKIQSTINFKILFDTLTSRNSVYFLKYFRNKNSVGNLVR